MTVILVGPAEDRARLRATLNGAVRVVGEFPTLAAAESSGLESDGILLTRGVRLKPDTTSGEVRLKPDTTFNRYRLEPDATYRQAYQEPLTPREVQVLELLAEGLPNKSIAERLGISDQTVKFHVASISGKLGAANRTDAVRRAVRRGLITL
jgi:DNA-binding CsgD family transcriptional regulator